MTPLSHAAMLISAIVGHLVGDYLLQNDWMAANKKKSTKVCAVHCFCWTVAVVGFGFWPLWTFIPLFLSHFVQDRTQLVSWLMHEPLHQSAFADGACAPWSSIVVDNVLHIVAIWMIWRFFL